jgi:hypothetical protein
MVRTGGEVQSLSGATAAITACRTAAGLGEYRWPKSFPGRMTHGW